MKTQTFTVFLIDGGHDQEQKEREIRLGFNRKMVDITYQLHRKRRSIQQNRARFGIAYKAIAERLAELWGERIEPEDVHEWVKQENRFAWIFEQHSVEQIYKDMPDGNKIRLPNSTRRLSTIGDNILYEELQKFASESLGISIQSPNEQIKNDSISRETNPL